MKIIIFLNNNSGIGSADFAAAIRKVAAKAEVITCNTDAEVIRHMPDAEVLACFASGFSPEFLKHAKKLKWLHSFAAGVDRFLTPEIIASDIKVTNSSGVHPIQIGEHTFGMILAFERAIITADRNKALRKWDSRLQAGEIYGKTVLIVGAGNIGARIAFLAKAFGCTVTGISRSGKNIDNFDKMLTSDNLNAALKDADYVVSILPYTKETERIFSKKQFAVMKKSAVFVNVGRGKTVDEPALISALKKGTIRAALLDVFEQEPLPKESPLWGMDNVVITPHNAGDSPKYMERARDIFIENLKAYNAKKKMPTEVDKAIGY